MRKYIFLFSLHFVITSVLFNKYATPSYGAIANFFSWQNLQEMSFGLWMFTFLRMLHSIAGLLLYISFLTQLMLRQTCRKSTFWYSERRVKFILSIVFFLNWHPCNQYMTSLLTTSAQYTTPSVQHFPFKGHLFLIILLHKAVSSYFWFSSMFEFISSNHLIILPKFLVQT